LKPPIARAKDRDWLKAQSRPLWQLHELSREYDAPILCAGDVFDKWNSVPELINWALLHLPPVYAIPGQHDLPNHSYELIHKSAYKTLAMTPDDRGIYDLPPNESHLFRGVHIEAFPWGHPLTPPRYKGKDRLKVALIHRYVWTMGKAYPGAPKEDNVLSQTKSYKGWDVVVYGDNHKGFLSKKGKTTIFNCGALQRRKSDEIGYRPQVGILFRDGTVKPHRLDISEDVIEETARVREAEEDMELTEFLVELNKLQDTELDFEEAMKRVLQEKKPGGLVREMILEAME
jgi:DNA repair exonuclease SbcCD nuclease subunit